MQFAHLTLLALAIASVQAICNDAGDVWGAELDQVVDNLDAVCDELVGDYESQAYNSTCRKSGASGKLFGFHVSRTGLQMRTLRHAECVWHLANEIYGCRRGGMTTVLGWYFRAVPHLEADCPHNLGPMD
ncbi:hypothetical protein HBI49_135480 [Parastagonospora nodorum]|nr:hypothetical protein HBI49_135480 [Parastagonospora nodorum]KAH5998735.1 hypothetical protein HBI84_107340 [Parastagonospora nodorum]